MTHHSNHQALDVLDVIIIGAGISGIGAARALVDDGRNIAIIEARSDLGGTWDLFRYPGIRSDSDMATFGYRSKPWDQDRSLAPGGAILEYLHEAADEKNLRPLIRFGQKAVRSAWSSENNLWTVTTEDTVTGQQSSVTGRTLFVATGYYRYDRGFTPQWPTLNQFTGQVIHPQLWPKDLDVAGKKVVVIGSGATAVTLLPNLADQGAHVTMLQRSPTYIASVPAIDKPGKRLRKVLPARIAGELNRWRNILRGMFVYEFSRRKPEKMRKLLREGVVKHLGPTFPVDTHFSPDYNPWDQRLCAAPSGDFFKAIRSGNADVVTDGIGAFTSHGVQLTSGQHLDADIIITATGLDVLFFGGMELVVDEETIDPASRVAYRGMMLDGVPNLAFAIGYTNASWTLKIDLITDYFRRVLGEMDRRGSSQVIPQYVGGREELAPLIDLAAGYVKRGQQLLPRQGRTGAWRIRQNYFTDKVLFRRGAERDHELQYSNS